MPPNNIQDLLEQQGTLLKEYEQAQRQADDAVQRAKSLTALPADKEAAAESCEAAGKRAYLYYVTSCELNNLNSEAEAARHREFCDKTNEDINRLHQERRSGNLADDEFNKKRQAYLDAMEQSSQDAMKIRKENDEANQLLGTKYNTISEDIHRMMVELAPPQAVIIQSTNASSNQSAKNKNTNPFIDAYIEQFSKSNSDFYKKKTPHIDADNKTHLAFKDPEDMASFAKKMADQKQSFIMVDEKTNQVLAYSNGDGKLFKGNGELCKDGLLPKAGDKNLPTLEEHQAATTKAKDSVAPLPTQAPLETTAAKTAAAVTSDMTKQVEAANAKIKAALTAMKPKGVGAPDPKLEAAANTTAAANATAGVIAKNITAQAEASKANINRALGKKVPASTTPDANKDIPLAFSNNSAPSAGNLTNISGIAKSKESKPEVSVDAVNKPSPTHR